MKRTISGGNNLRTPLCQLLIDQEASSKYQIFVTIVHNPHWTSPLCDRKKQVHQPNTISLQILILGWREWACLTNYIMKSSPNMFLQLFRVVDLMPIPPTILIIQRCNLNTDENITKGFVVYKCIWCLVFKTNSCGNDDDKLCWGHVNCFYLMC